MIIFDLDGTLADCEHRRHFIDPKAKGLIEWGQAFINNEIHKCYRNDKDIKTIQTFTPDWKAFYEACDKDLPIQPVIEMFRLISMQYDVVQIWAARCESVRQKTLNWIIDNFKAGMDEIEYFNSILKMRPIGDNTPEDQLKERWLDELSGNSGKIDFVFDDTPKGVHMWHRRGIFVFDVNQSGKEF